MQTQNGKTIHVDEIDYDSIMRAVVTELARQQNGKRTGTNGVQEAGRMDRDETAVKERAILEARAQALAQVPQETSVAMMQLVVFKLTNETYGIATQFVREVQPLEAISPVPCTPDFVMGVINIRGAIYSVIDIRQFLGVPRSKSAGEKKVILVNAARLEVGILADDVLGEISIPQAEMKAPLATRAGLKEEYVQGVTRDMLSVLNLEALLGDENIIVHEEVG